MGAEELAGVVIAQQVAGEMIWSCCRLDIAGQMLLCWFGVMATRSVRIPFGEMMQFRGDQSLVSHARDVRLIGGDCEEHKFDRWGNLVEWDHWLELR